MCWCKDVVDAFDVMIIHTNAAFIIIFIWRMQYLKNHDSKVSLISFQFEIGITENHNRHYHTSEILIFTFNEGLCLVPENILIYKFVLWPYNIVYDIEYIYI